jgi:NAD(P)H-dependent flavin oxidoreductase YrpB (nitropropane dioxygenase family)
MTGPRRFSQAISEGDGISVVAEVDGADAARRAEEAGAEGVLVHVQSTHELDAIRNAVSVPVLVHWSGDHVQTLDSADACIVDLEQWSGDAGTAELAVRVQDEEQLDEALEKLDPELFVLSGRHERPLEGVLDLLPDVPAGKLAIADLPSTTRADVEELERAGVDAVIVRVGNIADLIGETPPEV